MTLVMFWLAEISGQKEIIFPEIAAVMTGAWIAEKQPWNVNKRRIFLLMSLSAIIGVVTVKYSHVHLFFQILICFLFTGVALIVAKSSFIPIISACILPVYMQTTSWVYPLAVAIMSLIVIAAQWLMEKNRLRPKNIYSSEFFDLKFEISQWAKLLLVFAVISFLPVQSRHIFLLAPPLIVTYAEFANPNSPLRHKKGQVWAIMVFAATIGTVLRLGLNSFLELPLSLSAILACVLLFIVFDRVKILFPPSGAILLLPLILPTAELVMFPFEVAIGTAFLIFIAVNLFKKAG